MCIVILQAYAYVSMKSVFFRLFTKLDASINRPVNSDVTYNNVLKWDEMGVIFWPRKTVF